MLAQSLFAAAAVGVLVSAQLQPPAGGCTSNSFTIPSWFIQDLEYTASSKTVSFNIKNRATNHTAESTCALGSDAWNACELQAGTPGSSEGTLEASIQLSDTASAQILVNQTWSCSDRNGTTL